VYCIHKTLGRHEQGLLSSAQTEIQRRNKTSYKYYFIIIIGDRLKRTHRDHLNIYARRSNNRRENLHECIHNNIILYCISYSGTDHGKTLIIFVVYYSKVHKCYCYHRIWCFRIRAPMIDGLRFHRKTYNDKTYYFHVLSWFFCHIYVHGWVVDRDSSWVHLQ